MNGRTAIQLIVLIPSLAFSQNRYDVVIDEIMADPSPQVGLPANEWIELRNISSLPVNLQGWVMPQARAGPFRDLPCNRTALLLFAPAVRSRPCQCSVRLFPSQAFPRSITTVINFFLRLQTALPSMQSPIPANGFGTN